MANVQNCPKCGAPVPASAAEGLCPACLLLGALNPHHSNPPDFDPAASENDPAPLPGETLRFGDYELLAPIAHGGMGVVWRARQPQLNRVVALKMIRAGRFAGPDDVRRFRLEAEAVARLEHPHIVPIYEFGEYDGRPFFTMKLIEGCSLAQRVTRSGRDHEAQTPSRITEHASPPSASQASAPCDLGGYEAKAAATLLAKVARAVHFAHQRGILHRDLKPANILLDEQGEPYVTDFGLAKFVVPPSGGEFVVQPLSGSGASGPAKAGTTNPLTLTGQALGTPAYMAPEQAAGPARDLTTAADVYSLGAILFHLLTGQPPFAADTPLATLRAVVEQEPPRPSTLHPLVDRDLETICLKCLEKDPPRRYPTALALAEDLERWLRGEAIHARPSSVWQHGVKWAKRHPALGGLLALAFVAPAVIITVLLVMGAKLTRERNLARQYEQKATTDAARAESDELAARERAYAADLYAAFQALAVDDLALARRLLNEHRPAFGVPPSGGSGTNSIPAQGPAEAGTPNAARRSTLNPQPSTDLRGFEWRVLWERTRGQEAFAFTNLARPAACLVFAPDGRTLVSGGDDGIHLWDIAERRPIGVFPGPDPDRSGAPALAVDDARRLLETSPAVVEHLKLHPAVLNYLLTLGHPTRTRAVTSLAFSPDGKHLLAGSRDYVRSWNFATREFGFAVPEQNAFLAVPATGDFFVVANNQKLDPLDEAQSAHPQSALVYSFTRRRLVAELPGYGVRAVVSPDGQYVAAVSGTGGAVLWRPATGETSPLSHDPQYSGLLSFSPDGRTLLLRADSRASPMLWDVEAKRITAYLRNDRIHFGTVAWSPAGRFLAAGGENQNIGLWALPPGGATNHSPAGPPFLLPQTILHGHEDTVTALAFSPDGRWLTSAANDHSIRLWSLALPSVPAPVPVAGPDHQSMYELSLDAETGCVIGRSGGELNVWDAQQGYTPHALPGTERHFPAGFLAHSQGFVTVEMTANGVPVSLAIRRLPEGTVQTQRDLLPAPDELQSAGYTGPPFLASSPDGQWLAVPQNSPDRVLDLHVFALATGKFVARLPGQPGATLWNLRASPDSRWLVRLTHHDGENRITLYDARSWQLAHEITFRSAGIDVAGAAIDPASRFIATGGTGENSLRIWDLQTGRLAGHCNGNVIGWHPAWSRDSRTLVVRDTGSLRLWSMVVFRELAALPVDWHRTQLPLGFTADGRSLVTLTLERRVAAWTPPALAEIDGESGR